MLPRSLVWHWLNEINRALCGLNIVHSGAIKALQRKQSLTGALFYAGIDRFADLMHLTPTARLPLVKADAFLTRQTTPDPLRPQN